MKWKAAFFIVQSSFMISSLLFGIQNNQAMVMQKGDYSLISSYLEALSIPKEVKQLISLEEFSQKNPDYYMRYPRLFRHVFGKQTDEQIDLLCIAGFLYYRSIIFMDAMLDGKIKRFGEHATMVPVAVSVCQEEAIKILTHIFGWKSDFWHYWNLRKKEYLQAYFLEKKLSSDESLFSVELYENIAEKKAAIGKVAIDALFVLGGQKDEERYQALIAGHEFFSIGLQLNDDFQDFEEDAQSAQFNWVVYYTWQLLSGNKLKQTVESRDVVFLKKMMYINGVADKTLNLSLEYFDKASESLSALPVIPEFADILEDRKVETLNVLQQIKEYFAILHTQIRLDEVNLALYSMFPLLPTKESPINALLNKAFQVIIDDANTDFSDLKHIMYLGSQEGFDNASDIHIGDVFQRAILLEMLCDLRDRTDHPGLQPIIHAELDYLYAQKLRTSPGGWSYFPTVKEIAPDADDLGQILQVFARSGRNDFVNNDCLPLLEILFSDNYVESSGAFETWIIPRENRTELQALQDHFNATKWGKGPDPEVVANLLYGVKVAGLNQYETQIQRGISYLLTQQHPGGLWKSRWYYGPYYGTYVCLRLLCATETETPAIKKALDGLSRIQRPDGSWANHKGESSPLSTALALSCFALYEQATYSQCIDNARKYLIHEGLDHNGRYPAEPFIIPKGGQPYKSKTITTAYVLKALMNTRTIK